MTVENIVGKIVVVRIRSAAMRAVRGPAQPVSGSCLPKCGSARGELWLACGWYDRWAD